MTEEQIEARFNELDVYYSSAQIELVKTMLREQRQQIDLLIWQFRENEAKRMTSPYAAINYLWKAIRESWAPPPNGERRRKIVYIAHPVAGDVEANLADLRRILKWLNESQMDVVPIAPYYADVVSIGEEPEMRERGIDNDIAILKAGFIDEVWLTGPRVSAGMEAEAALANLLVIRVFDKTTLF